MGKLQKILIPLVAIMGIITPQIASAMFDEDIIMEEGKIKFSSDYLVEGKSVRIYATATNASSKDLLGTIKFINKTTGAQISSDQPISLFSGKTDDVFVDWIPEFPGTYNIQVKMIPWQTEKDDPKNNDAEITITILKDTDRDGMADKYDADDDNDKYDDNIDKFPLNKNEWEDTDGDNNGNNADTDDDNDGYEDNVDKFPENPLEWEDTDNDNIGNNVDEDDDNDNLSDKNEESAKTDPLNPDTDSDGARDGNDAFPSNSAEWKDYDKDGTGNNSDEDDDNDDILDKDDYNPENKGPVIVLKNKHYFVPLKSKIEFDAGGSYDEDGNIVKIEWEIDGNKIEGEKIAQIFEQKGKYVMKLTAVDDKGETRSMTMTINAVDYIAYLRILLFIILIALALVIFFQYIKAAKKREKKLSKR